MKNIFSPTLIFLSLSFWGCKKVIVEPENGKVVRNQIYVRVDNEEFLFDDKSLNFSKKTRADIKTNGGISEYAISAYTEFNFVNKKNEKRMYYFSKGVLSFDFINYNP